MTQAGKPEPQKKSAPQTPAPKTGRAWSMGKPLVIGFCALLALLLGFGLWGATADLAGAIVASGQIEVEQNRQIVQHPDGGVVASVEVIEGQRVEAGEILLRLDGTLITSELAIVESNLDELTVQRARLEAERDGANEITFPPALLEAAKSRVELAGQITAQSNLFKARAEADATYKQQLGRQIDQIHSRVKGIDAQAKAIEIQLELIQQELATQRGLLERGLAQMGSVLALQREEARLMGQTGDLMANRAQSEERATEIELQIGSIDLRRREEAADGLRAQNPQELELAERRRALQERIARLEIRAPVAGVVIGLTVTTPRAVVRAAEPLLYIVPQDRPLVIAAQVSPIDIDQVFVGQDAELVFSSFSTRTTPHLFGKVTVVSADAFTNQQAGFSFYRVELELNPGEREKLGDLALLPGMPVESFIQTDSRTPLAYLVKPFTDYFNRAFRES